MTVFSYKEERKLSSSQKLSSNTNKRLNLVDVTQISNDNVKTDDKWNLITKKRNCFPKSFRIVTATELWSVRSYDKTSPMYRAAELYQ